MIRSLWIAKTGLDAQQTQMDVISNNLANVSTTGFKRARAVFEDLLYQTIRQPGAQSTQQNQLPSGFQLGVGARVVATERIHSQGSLQQTENALDVEPVEIDRFVTLQMNLERQISETPAMIPSETPPCLRRATHSPTHRKPWLHPNPNQGPREPR